LPEAFKPSTKSFEVRPQECQRERERERESMLAEYAITFQEEYITSYEEHSRECFLTQTPYLI